MSVDIILLVSQDNSPYIDWQTKLFYRSFKQHYPIPNYSFVSLINQDNTIPSFEYNTFRTSFPTQADHIEGSRYVLYDRAFNIREYVQSLPPANRYFLLCDTDFLFYKFFNFNKLSLSVYGQATNYVDPLCNKAAHVALDYYKRIINPLGKLEYYKALGWPYYIHEHTLRAILDRWVELMVMFRCNPDSPCKDDWICDMYSMNIALMELEMYISDFDIVSCPPWGWDQPALFHYCYHVNDKDNKKVFDKREYKYNPLPSVLSLENVTNPCGLNFLKTFNTFLAQGNTDSRNHQ